MVCRMNSTAMRDLACMRHKQVSQLSGTPLFPTIQPDQDRIQVLAWTFAAAPRHNLEPSSVEIPFKQTAPAGSQYRQRLKSLSGKSARKALFRATVRLASLQVSAAKLLCSMVSKSLAIPARAWISLR